ncbi:MAG: sigma-70 family RNA polymerase sigma factor [Chloroflexota bacterium]
MTAAPSGSLPRDEELMEQVARGDSAALSALYQRYAGAVFSLAFRVVNDREAAEELLNEAFVRVWRQAPLFDARRGKFSTWLLSVARNLSIDELRSRRARPRKADPVGDEDVPSDLVDEHIDVEAEVWQHERRALIREAMEQLPAPQREALELAYFHGLTQSEVAARLGDPLGTTKTRMRLGLQKLRDILLVDGLGREIS